MSVSKALVYLQQMEKGVAPSDPKKLATLLREALLDIDARLKALERGRT